MHNQVERTYELIRACGGEYLVLIDDLYTNLFTGERIAPENLDEMGWAQLVRTANEVGEVAGEYLEALLSVEGVDMVNSGAADYSMGLGLTGQFDHPRVTEAEQYVIETALRLGIAPRVEITDPGDAVEVTRYGGTRR